MVFDGLYQGAFVPLPHGSIKRIDDSLHFIMIDRPAAFETAVERLLKN